MYSVYRLFNREGALLYVGATRALETRLSAHAKVQPWWDEVDMSRIHVSTHSTAREAGDVEVAAIESERPKYNIAGASRAYGRYPVPDRERPPDADLDALRAQMNVAAKARERLESLMRERDNAIRAALDHGHSVEMIRAVTGRSRAWVYAIRDGRRRP